MILTPEQFEEFQAHGTVDGRPINAKTQQKCSQCGLPLTDSNRAPGPHEKRWAKGDKRCYNCVEIPNTAAELEADKSARRVDAHAEILVKKWKREDKRRRNKARRAKSRSQG